jgi:hypothetical protein
MDVGLMALRRLQRDGVNGAPFVGHLLRLEAEDLILDRDLDVPMAVVGTRNSYLGGHADPFLVGRWSGWVSDGWAGT